ncbi:MAG: hypothetical protein ACKOB6_02585 [Candidatus Kapaibacterium sp.]
MPFNLLLLPLLGGFVLATELHSFFVLAVVRGLAPSMYLSFESSFTSVLGTELRYAAEAMLSLLLSFPVTKLINRLYPEDRAIVSAIIEHNNAFEMLCLRSLDGGHPAMLTMRNDAVTIGWIREISSPFESTHIPVIPIRSGHRRDDGSVMFTTNYLEVYDRLSRVDGELDKARFIREFSRNTTVLPKQEIIASTFYYKDYERLHSATSL